MLDELHSTYGPALYLMKIEEFSSQSGKFEKDRGSQRWLLLHELIEDCHVCERIRILKISLADPQTHKLDRMYKDYAIEMELLIE